jgi:hypothetical protein
MEAPGAVKREHRLAAAVQIEGLRRQPGRLHEHGEHSQPAKSGSKAHGRVSQGEAGETWIDANAEETICTADFDGTGGAIRLVLQLYFLQALETRQRSGPEGPANALFFRGLKPPAPSRISDVHLWY